mgnify:CR=1 FL=1
MPTTLSSSHLPGLDLVHRGKVRDVYALSADELLIVASDRLSAFDVVLPDPIPGKGEMLTQMSNFWFAKTRHLLRNHLLERRLADVLPAGVDLALYARRSVICKRLKPIPFNPRGDELVGGAKVDREHCMEHKCSITNLGTDSQLRPVEDRQPRTDPPAELLDHLLGLRLHFFRVHAWVSA